MNKKNGQKLLAVFAVIAVVACVFATVPVADANVSTVDQMTINETVFKVEYEDSMKNTGNGTSYVFEGYSTAGNIAGVSTNFGDTFETSVNAGNALWSAMQIKFRTNSNVFIKQTNGALEEATFSDSENTIEGKVKEKAYGDNFKVEDFCAFLIPKTSDTVKIEIFTYEGEYNGNTELVPLATFNFNFSKVSTKVILGATAIGTSSNAVYYTGSGDAGTLTLNAYTGKEIFSHPGTLTVTLSAENIINADLEQEAANDIAAIKASTLNVTGTGTLTVNLAGTTAFGLHAGTVNIGTGSSTSTDKTNVNVYGGNRAVYAHSGNIIISNAVVNVTAYEKPIRSEGELEIKFSTVDAGLLTPPSNNSLGADDYFGIKADNTITVEDSTVTTDGIHIVAGITLGDKGIVNVNGDYMQNPDAGILSPISGLYYVQNGEGIAALEVYNARPTGNGAANGYILLQNNAVAYGNVNVIGADGTTVQPAAPTADSVEKIEEIMEGTNDQPIFITTGLTMDDGDAPLVVTQDIIVGVNSTLNLSLGTDSANVIIPKGVMFNGTVSNANNAAKFVGVTGEITITYGSIDVGGTFASGTIKITNDFKIHGTVTGAVNIETDSNKPQKITLSDDLNVSSTGTLTLGNNIVLVVPKGKVFDVNGALTITAQSGTKSPAAIAIYGAVDVSGATTVTGTAGAEYAVAEGATLTGTLTGMTSVSIYKFEDATGVNNTITGDTTWNSATYLSNDLVIAEDVTVTIGKTGFLDLCGYDLIVKGTLVIENKGYVLNKVTSSGAIMIASTGAIENDGIIGSGAAVKVQTYSSSEYTGVGSVELLNVKGVEFGTKKIVSGSAITYTLTVSGDIAYTDKAANKIEFTDALIDADTTIGSYVNTAGEINLTGKAILTMSGIGQADIVIDNGSSVIINGNQTGTIGAATGVYKTYKTDGSLETAPTLGTSSITLDNVTGITVAVSSKTYVDDSEVSWTEQMMSISGTPAYVTLAAPASNTTGAVTFVGEIYVFAGNEVTFLKGMSFTGGTVIAEGKVTTITDTLDGYKGSMYEITTTGSSDITNVYTNFTDAFAAIDTADGKTVTLKGGYEFTGTTTVLDGQTITFGDGAAYTVAADASITVMDGAEVSNEFTKIEGIVTVMDGGDCTPAPASYEVKSENEAGDVTYSSAAIAIENAAAGTTVYIVGNAVLKENVTVNPGVTIEITDGSTLTANKGLNVAAGGKIVNEGDLVIANNYDLVVAGEVDSTDGTITLGTTDSVMDVTGTVVSSQNNLAANAAKYVDAGEVVYTSVATAIADVSEMDVKVKIDVIGKFSEKGNLVLTNGMELSIPAGADIVLGTVTLGTGSKLTAIGSLTATIAGESSDGTAMVVLEETSNIRFVETNISSTDTDVLTMSEYDTTLPGIKGAVNATAGNVTVGGDMTFNGTLGTMTIDGTVTVPDNASIDVDYTANKTALTVNGTLDIIEGTLNVAGIAVINGTVNVSESDVGAGIQIDETNAGDVGFAVLGTINVSSETGKKEIFNIVDGAVTVGKKVTSLGAVSAIIGEVTLADNEYITVYAGADMAGAMINYVDDESTARSTVFNINGVEYMTVYAAGAVTFETVIDAEKFQIPEIVVGEDGITPTGLYDSKNWYTSAKMTADTRFTGFTGNIGSEGYAAVFAKAAAAKVDVTYSIGTGISLYVDNVKVQYLNGVEMKIEVGEHTVFATVDPGYKGDVVITVNGTAVTGSFVVTADMTLVTVTASGDITTDSTVIVSPSEAEGGMSLTDILLIVLVVLILIMAAIVAMRLMRN